jgi:hypothetical protein
MIVQGWAKQKRARHLLRRLQTDGGHGALRLCPPYALRGRYNFLGRLIREGVAVRMCKKFAITGKLLVAAQAS